MKKIFLLTAGVLLAATLQSNAQKSTPPTPPAPPKTSPAPQGHPSGPVPPEQAEKDVKNFFKKAKKGFEKEHKRRVEETGDGKIIPPSLPSQQPKMPKRNHRR